MKRFATLSVSVLLVTAMFFQSGCASTADGRTTQAQGTAIGAIGGALLGAALGAATGNTRNIAAFAAGGAVAGGTAGFIYGTAVAKRKAKYARAELWLDQEIALARQANGRAYAYNASLKKRIATLDARIRVARSSGDKGALRTAKAEIRQIQNQAGEQSKSEAQAASDVKEVLADPQAKSAANYSSYRSEANSFNQARAERGQLLGRLASLDNSLDR